MIFRNIFLSLAILFPVVLNAQVVEDFFKSAGTPVNPKVEVLWNRYYTNDGLENIANQIQKAYPNLVQLESIGKSFEGREIWALTITSKKNGSELEKPGFYIDGNIHSNEVQGSEIALYTAWYLTENYDKNKFLTELLDDKVFYIIPTINPDARDNYMREVNSASTPRSGMMPVDDDRDGMIDEDGFDDIDGDGNLTMMRRKSEYGKWKLDPSDSRRMIRVGADEFGDYEMLGYEGLDNDGDGRVNEDRTGYYDPNRDWGYNWQPDYMQRGAMPYPFYVPENKAVRDFVIAHPNIAGAQTYHNTGGMILRGPAQKDFLEVYTREDELVINTIGERGDKMLPGYKFMLLWRDLYPVYGGEIDWFYGSRGIYVFTNELFTSQMYFGNTYENRWDAQGDQYDFDKYLLFGDAWIDWKEFDHPDYGKIEVGGFNKNYGRPHPGFLLETDAHRNMAFTIYHAYQTPKISITDISVKNIGSGLQEVTVHILNERITPTRSGQNAKYNIDPKDLVVIEGVKSIAKMVVENEDLNITTVQSGDPSIIQLESIPGMSVVKVRFITEKSNKFKVGVKSAKGGHVWKQML